MVIQEQIDEIKRRIVENFKPEKIILFGSYADGNPKEDSDLDLLIIKDSNYSPQRYRDYFPHESSRIGTNMKFLFRNL